VEFETCALRAGGGGGVGKTSVPDPKLIISDPDPQIENKEFWIRIQILIRI